MNNKYLKFTLSAALLLALFVLMLGAYTRLTDAGLGCPDWPGCYGHMMPVQEETATQITDAVPKMEQRKAWTEMLHRYAAGSLALLIVVIFFYALTGIKTRKAEPKWLAFLLALLIVFQALLGMWTVTLKLLPAVVMGHLLGGMSIFACLCYLRWQWSFLQGVNLGKKRFWIRLGFILVFCQIALGAWVSSNYAGIACVGFPQCNGQWMPKLYFAEGFNLFSPIGANYQGGLLENHLRVSIQVVHRLGALVTASYWLILASFLLLRQKQFLIRAVLIAIILLILLQVTLGILNVLYLLPLWLAVAHNGVAALLLAAVVSLLYLSQGKRIHAATS